VLQEVAAARHILMMCGSTEIEGYAFCSGISALKLSYKAHPGLQTLIQSVNYLIQGANLRPKRVISQSARASLDIRPLGDLIDMYHNRQASERHDKIYALLGMSSDDPGAAGILPNYDVSWKDLFLQVVHVLVGEQASVETWDEREIAVIKSQGCIIGHVSSVKEHGTWDDRPSVEITSGNPSKDMGHKGGWSSRWTVRASAAAIQEGDLVCLLRGSSKPTIVRLLDDYCVVVAITVTPPARIQTESGYIQWSEILPSIAVFPHDFLLVWDWEESPGQPEGAEGHRSFAKSQRRKRLSTQSDDDLEEATRLRNVGLILEHLGKYWGAGERLKRALRAFETVSGEDHLDTLTAMDALGSIYKQNWQWKEAEELYGRLMQIRKRVLGTGHSDTLSSMANLALTYRSQGGPESVEKTRNAKKLEVMIEVLKRQADYTDVTEEGVLRIARVFDEEVVTLLLEHRGDEVPFTEKIVIQIAGSLGQELMRLLLEKKGADVQITEGVVEAAAENRRRGKDVMTVLLQEGGEIQVTEEAVIQIARSFDQEVMELLLEKKGAGVQITKGVVQAAAENRGWGEGVMTVLLQGGDGIRVTEEAVIQIARWFDREIMELLVDKKGADVEITEEVVRAAAQNDREERVISFLLEQGGDKVQNMVKTIHAEREQMVSRKKDKKKRKSQKSLPETELL
jgi:tetratricopeptide (TPR) repeat protein